MKNEETDLPLEIKTETPKITDDIDALEFLDVDTDDRVEGIDDASNDEDNIRDLKQRKTSLEILIEAPVINNHDRLRNDDIDGLNDDISIDNDIQNDTNSLNEIDTHAKLLNTKNIKDSLNTKNNKSKNNKDVFNKKNKVSPTKLKLVSEAKCKLKSKLKKPKDKSKLKDIESFECKDSCAEKISSEENEVVTEVKKKRGRPKKIRPPPEPKGIYT